MARLAKPILARVHAIEAELRTLVEGGAPALAMVTAALPELLGVGNAMSYVLTPMGDGLRVDQAFTAGLPRDLVPAFELYLADKRVGWTLHNPIRPEAEQRNAALHYAGLRRLLGTPDGPPSSPVMRAVLSRFGLGASDNLRVLVCDGPSLLAWVGSLRPDPFDDTQRRTLQRLVPALRRRLMVERLLARGGSTRALFDAAFEAIPAPAFVTDIAGTVLEGNAPALVWLAREGRDLHAALRRSVKRGGCARFTVTPVVSRGSPDMRLLVLRPGGEMTTAQRAAAAAKRWSLTVRQAEVLALLVEGLTTRTIAAQLATREGTVEAHLTAMFAKAQVESRAELVAAVWRMG